MAATGVAGYVLFLYVLYSEQTQEKLNALWEAGIRKIFRARSVVIKDEYHSRILTAKELDLIGFGLSSFRQDYNDSFRTFAATKKVRILLLDPDFPDRAHTVASLRDLEEGNHAGRIGRDISDFIEAARPVIAEFPDTFQVRLMRALPAINYFRIDDALFWGPYLIGSQSRNTPTILLSRGGYLFDTLQKHFEYLWTDPRFSTALDAA